MVALSCLLFHHWTRWTDPRLSEISRFVEDRDPIGIGFDAVQERHCTICNKYEYRVEKVRV